MPSPGVVGDPGDLCDFSDISDPLVTLGDPDELNGPSDPGC